MNASSSTATATSKRPRPRGLWKARATPGAPRSVVPERKSPSDSDSDYNHDSSLSIKRTQRFLHCDSIDSSSSDDDDDDDDDFRWDFARRQACLLPDRERGWKRRQRIMDTTSTAFAGSQTEAKQSCDLEDWMDLKDLFAKAAEQYETGTANDALPLLRGVIHECHSFLNFYQDPSVIFAGPREDLSSLPHKNSWDLPEKRKCTCVELPTAFHAILGTALFLFGNLIDQDSSLALPGEPDAAIIYWLYCLDVLETADNLPSRVYGTGCDAPEDWRMAIIWGRTLVALADATISRDPGKTDAVASFCADEPTWPIESPFTAIAMRRPPLTHRMTLSRATANDLMVLAMDQFSRGIFHMPHPQHIMNPPRLVNASCCSSDSSASCHVIAAVQTGPASPPHSMAKSFPEAFSRPKELYTIASEVMLLSEKLPLASERQFWACWADSVLNQMKMEANMDSWRCIISRARGKCWLIAGSACADEIEDKLEMGDETILATEEAEDAREDLGKAIEFLDKGRAEMGEEEEERKKMLAEALLTLANLTLDKAVQDALYQRAREEGAAHLMDIDYD